MIRPKQQVVRLLKKKKITNIVEEEGRNPILVCTAIFINYANKKSLLLLVTLCIRTPERVHTVKSRL